MEQLKTTLELKYNMDQANKAIDDLMKKLNKELEKLEYNHGPLEEKLILIIEYETINKNKSKNELIEELRKEIKELKEKDEARPNAYKHIYELEKENAELKKKIESLDTLRSTRD